MSAVDERGGVRFARDLHWSCLRCGSCCRHFALGPLTAEDEQRVRRTEPRKWWTAKGGPPWRVVTGGAGASESWLARGERGCVFLARSGACALHEQAGIEAKPSFCQGFPFRVVEVSEGPLLVVDASCAGFSRTWRQGQPLAEIAARIAHRTPEAPCARRLLDPVPLVPGKGISAEDYSFVLDDLLARTEGGGEQPLAHPVAVRDRVHALLRLAPPRPDPDQARDIAREQAAAFHALLAAASRSLPAEAPTGMRQVTRSGLAAARSLVEGPLLRGNGSLVESLHTPLESAEWVAVLVRQGLLSREFFLEGDLCAGLGAFAFRLLLCRAHVPPDRPLAPETLGTCWADLQVLFNHPGIRAHLAGNGRALAALMLSL